MKSARPSATPRPTRYSESSRNQEKRLTVEIGSLIALASAAFLAAAIFTYDGNDPSPFTQSHQAVQNACGWVGATLAALLLNGVGVGALLVPAALVFLASCLHHREGLFRFLSLTCGMVVAVLALTVFLSFQIPTWSFGQSHSTQMLTGGVIGAWVADLLKEPLKPAGASIVSVLVFVIALVVSTPLSIAKYISQILNWIWVSGFKLTRISLRFLAYSVGLISVKAAERGIKLVQAALESSVSRIRERKALLKSITGLSPAPDRADDDRVEPVARFPQQPVIGLESENEAESMSDGAEQENAPISVSENEEVEEAVLDMAELKNEIEIMPAERPKVEASPRKLRRKVGQWQLPTIEFLRRPPKVESTVDRNRLIENSLILRQKLLDFGIEGEITAVRPGPVITLYEFRPGPGIKVSRIAALADDLSMALSAESVRILAPLPGKSVVGIEIPSENRETVFLREFLQSTDFFGDRFSIPVVMGKDIGGMPILADLARMPHLLCAGQTGSGKSVFMNSLICSLLYRYTPDDVRLILVDPKFIEFRSYQDIPHLLLPVVDNPKHASSALKWAVREMERRYRILAMVGARNLAGYNQRVEEMTPAVIHDLLVTESESMPGDINAGGDWIESFEVDENGMPKVGKLPTIVVIIDELADLMMVAKKDVEASIARIAQQARAAGIHMVVATQRPSTDVITGLIKANLPSRASFQLASYVDSKTILDRAGAERLLGQGDMLFIPPGSFQLQRLHSAFVSDEEIDKITSFLRAQGEPSYRQEILEDPDEDESLDGADGEEGGDELFHQAVDLVKRSGHASASFLQRHLRVGYNRAARMIELMEERGIVGPADGSRPREVLMR